MAEGMTMDAKACRTSALALAMVAAVAVPSRAQDLGFGLGDPYRHYADPGNGGGSAYTPFFDPYRGNRIVRGAYPDEYYDGRGYHYGKAAPPSLYVDPYDRGGDPYGVDPYGGAGRPQARTDLGPNADLTTREDVANATGQPAGTIVIDTGSRHLYLVEGEGRAIRYGIGVGRQGFAWHGTARVERKAEWPGWTPPNDMLKRRPDLPLHMEGGIENPLGARALYLFQGKRDTMFRIHGTNEPDTIGQAVSSGCIRMMNADVIDLYRRVPLGTRVVVL